MDPAEKCMSSLDDWKCRARIHYPRRLTLHVTNRSKQHQSLLPSVTISARSCEVAIVAIQGVINERSNQVASWHEALRYSSLADEACYRASETFLHVSCDLVQ